MAGFNSNAKNSKKRTASPLPEDQNIQKALKESIAFLEVEKARRAAASARSFEQMFPTTARILGKPEPAVSAGSPGNLDEILRAGMGSEDKESGRLSCASDFSLDESFFASLPPLPAGCEVDFNNISEEALNRLLDTPSLAVLAPSAPSAPSAVQKPSFGVQSAFHAVFPNPIKRSEVPLLFGFKLMDNPVAARSAALMLPK